MSESDFKGPTYPVVEFLVAQGVRCAWALALIVAVGAVLVALSTGIWWLGALGVALAAILLVVLISYVEVLRIIADTLLPKY